MKEQRFGPRDPAYATIGLAESFTGLRLPYTNLGLQIATGMLRAQHSKVMPPVNGLMAYRMVTDKDPTITNLGKMAALAISKKDLLATLVPANYLFFFGDIDYNDQLDGDAFEFSVRTHRELAEIICHKFLASDPFLMQFGTQILGEIEQARKDGKFYDELMLTRGVIHMVVNNGTLGEEARRFFDPFAIVDIK